MPLITFVSALSISSSIKGSGSFAPNSRRVETGSAGVPKFSCKLTSGIGDGQANQEYFDRRTVANGTSDDVDLSGVLKDIDGNLITLTKVKFFAVAIDEPDGVKCVRVGPQDVANPFIGPWTGDQGPDAFVDVYEHQEFPNTLKDGWPVVAGSGDKLRIHNPGASPLNYYLLIVGVQ